MRTTAARRASTPVTVDVPAEPQSAPKKSAATEPSLPMRRAKEAVKSAFEAVMFTCPPAYLVGGMPGALKMAAFMSVFGAVTGAMSLRKGASDTHDA